MFGIGGFEFFLILIFGFLIFGPDKLPSIAQTIGKAIAKFRGAQEDMTEQLKNATFVDKESDAPLKNPLDVIEGVVAGKKDAAPKTNAKPKPTHSDCDKKAESFAERKARYDREREERKRAEKDAQSEDVQGEGAQGAAKAGDGGQDASVRLNGSALGHADDANPSGQASVKASEKDACKDAEGGKAIKDSDVSHGEDKEGDGSDEPVAAIPQKAAVEEVD